MPVIITINDHRSRGGYKQKKEMCMYREQAELEERKYKEVQRQSDCCTERQTEVSRALSELSSVIQRYDNLVGRLSARLNSVVISAPPVANSGQEKASQGFQTDLGNQINGMRCTARDITDSLESLLERIEL